MAERGAPFRRWLLGGAVAAAALAVAIIAVISGSGSSSRRGSAGELTGARAALLARELRSGQPDTVAAAIALPPGAQLTSQTVRAFAALRALSLDAGSFRTLSPGVATVHSTLRTASGVVEHWNAILVKSTGQWKLAESTLIR